MNSPLVCDLLTFFVVTKTSIIDHVLNWAKFKADQQIKKTDGTKLSRYAFATIAFDCNSSD